VLDENSATNQFAVSQIPFHTHSGSDSQRVSYSNLSNKTVIIPYTLTGALAATAGNYSVFFTAPFAATVSQITEDHTALGTDGGAVSLDVEKLIGTTAPGSGVKITTAPFNLKSAINTVVTAQLSTFVGVVQLAAGDRLALRLTGTPTSVANVNITVVLSLD
jgi:hypothetical protein